MHPSARLSQTFVVVLFFVCNVSGGGNSIGKVDLLGVFDGDGVQLVTLTLGTSYVQQYVYSPTCAAKVRGEDA